MPKRIADKFSRMIAPFGVIGRPVIEGETMTEHKLKDCNCNDPHCPICVGGLGICIICGGAECELPRSCPGKPMTQRQKDAVCNGTMDFVYGKWEDYSE